MVNKRLTNWQHLKLGLLCMVTLLLADWVGRTECQYRTRLNLQHHAQQLWHDIHAQSQSLVQLLNHIPTYGCQPKVLAHLQSIVINHPEISVSFIQQRGQICSNVDALSLPPLPNTGRLGLTINALPTTQPFDTPMLMISIREKHRRKGVLIPQSFWQQLLEKNTPTQGGSALVRQANFAHPSTLVSTPRFTSHSLKSLKPGLQFDKTNHHLRWLMVLPQFNQTFIVVEGIPQFKWQYIAWIVGLCLCTTIAYLYRQRFDSVTGLLRRALNNHQFIAHYQPLVHMQTEEVTGVECLIRWQEHNNNLIYPDAFLETARKAGLSTQITAQLIDRIFDDLSPIATQHPDFHIGINFYPEDFVDGYLFHKLGEACQKYGIQPQQIMLELTEQERFQSDQENDAQMRMQQLREQGFMIAIDDFGTGNASVSYLRQFPFSHLKIDKLYTQAIGSKSITAQLTDSIIQLAQDCQLEIIAEGIETEAQRDYLQKLGVKLAQGWLFSKALSVEGLKKYMDSPVT